LKTTEEIAMTSDAAIARHSPGPVAMLDALSAPRRAIPLIAIVGALLFLFNLGGYPLYTKGEPREAVTVSDIVHGGGVILPMRAGVEIPSKPLLMHWLAAIISVVAGGISEWTVRLPSALCAIAAMLACYLYVRRLFEARAALVAALILGTAVQFVQAGRGARVDMTLTFLMEIAFFEFLAIAEGLNAQTTMLYFALALAILTKGPVGAVLPILVGIIWVAIYRRWELFSRLHLARGAAIVALIGGGWYLAAILVGGGAFIHKQILAENLYRLIPHGAAHEGHAHPFYYEEGALFAGLMPWTPVAAIALIQSLRKPRAISPRIGYLLVWTLTVLIFYNLPQSKRGVYLLGLYPALSAIVAIFLCDAIAVGDPAPRVTALLSRAYGGILAATGFGAMLGLAILFLWPGLIGSVLQMSGILVPELTSRIAAQAHEWPFLTIAIPIVIAGAGVYLLRARPKIERLIVAIVVGQVGVVLAINLVIEPAIAQTLALKDFAANARKFAGHDPVGYFGNLDYGFAFYNGRDLQLTTPLDASGPALVVSPEDDWKLVPPRLSVNYRVVLRSNPTDLDGSGRMLLLQRLAKPAPGGGDAAPPTNIHT
jgi:4-amino-4-deoxy-L-arabinose transferase-like glycosyltransferase